MTVAGEEDRDGGTATEVDGGESVVKNGLGYGGKIVLHIND